MRRIAVLAILIGAVSARRRDGPIDHALSVVTLALAALPEFVVGIAFVVLLGTTVFTLAFPTLVELCMAFNRTDGREVCLEIKK